MQELDSSKQRMRVKEKKEKAARLHAKLESAQKELQRSKEIGMKHIPRRSISPKKTQKAKQNLSHRHNKILKIIQTLI